MELHRHQTMAPSIASTTPASLTGCMMRCQSRTHSRTKYFLRGMVLTTSALLRVFIFEMGATSCDMCTAPSSRVSAKLHPSQLLDTSMFHDERCEAEFRKRLSIHRHFPGTSLEKQVDDLQHAFRDSAIRAFGRPRKVPVALWISKRTWEVVPLGGPIRRFMHNVRKRSTALFMSVAFYRWSSLFSVPFSHGETPRRVLSRMACIRTL